MVCSEIYYGKNARSLEHTMVHFHADEVTACALLVLFDQN